MSEALRMREVKGLGVSPGIAIGRAVALETRVEEVYRFPVADSKAEVARLNQAVEKAKEQALNLRTQIDEALGEELAGIFEAHALLLADPAFLKLVKGRICEEKVNAEWAVWEATEELYQRFMSIESEHLRERGNDIREVGRYLLQNLQGIAHHELSELEGDVVIIADDLTPSDAVQLGRQGVAGFALESGGRTSHAAIIAHSLNIPLVTGLEGITRSVSSDSPVIVDGTLGRVIIFPTEEVIAQYRDRIENLEREDENLTEGVDQRAETRCGIPLDLMANIDLPEEVDDAEKYGAIGVGLYRSEFLYIEMSPRLPKEEDHLEVYRKFLNAMDPHPVIVRTYDLGGRKLAREVMATREENPVLGLRGIRLTMARPEVFRIQLRGLFRAGLEGDLWILLPLVSTLEEVREFRTFADGVQDELDREGVPHCRQYKLGVMIEVPSAALISRHLAKEVDFFSIGTNDLIQYSMAVDRNNDHVADLYQPLHPSILTMIRSVVESADAEGIEVAVCGEMAADPQCALLLVGLGIRRLSMTPREVPVIKRLLKRFDLAQLRDTAEAALEMATAAEVAELLESSFNLNQSLSRAS